MADFAVDLKSDEFLKNRNVTFVSGGMGYGFPGFPPIICIGTDSDSVFYSLVLPLIILLGIGITIITLLFWFVHKVSKIVLYLVLHKQTPSLCVEEVWQTLGRSTKGQTPHSRERPDFRLLYITEKG